MISRKNMIFAVALTSLFYTGTVPAAVYKSVDAEGNVVYTDEPGDNGTPVDLPPLSTIPAPTFSPVLQTGNEAESAPKAYQSIGIVSPAQDETIRENSGAVSVEASIDPPLDTSAGHRFQFYLDGEPRSNPSATGQVQFQEVDRGQHELEVAVVDGNGNELIRSDVVRFHLHRISALFPPRPSPFRAD